MDGGAKQVQKRQLTVLRLCRSGRPCGPCNKQRATCAPHERGEALSSSYSSRVSIFGAVDRIISSSSITATPMPMPTAAVH